MELIGDSLLRRLCGEMSSDQVRFHLVAGGGGGGGGGRYWLALGHSHGLASPTQPPQCLYDVDDCLWMSMGTETLAFTWALMFAKQWLKISQTCA